MARRNRKKRRNTEATAGARVPGGPSADTEEPKVDPKVPAGQSDLPPEGADKDDLPEVHKEACDRYEQAWQKDRTNQSDAYDDLKFIAEDNAQWDGTALQARINEKRPILTVNKCPQYIRQVTGDIRQLRPSIHVVPVDERASDNISVDVLPEMVRYIERRSDAKAAYFHAADQMVSAGIGHARVFTEYAAGTTMAQEIAIGVIQDGIAVVWDCDSIHPTRKDALYCFVPIDMTRKAAELRWKGKSFDAPMLHEAWNGWYSDDSVRVTEYWRKCPYECEVAIYPDGKMIDLSDDDYDGKDESDEGDEYDDEDDSYLDAENVIPFAPPGPQRPPLGPGMGPKRADAIAGGATFEKRDSYRVERFVMSQSEILDGPEVWPGKEIPIVPFLGEEVMIGRATIRRGVIRTLKDVQRLYNYAISADAEAVALQPKSPFKGTRKNFESYQDEWETANSKNWPYLTYDPDPLNGGRPPEREPPPVASTGIKELLTVATADMSGVTGIYPSSLGAPAQETSGRAIVARQREGDTGTFVYIEAFGRAVERIGQIIIDLIPHVYDTERSLRVVGEDGKVSKIDINSPMVDPNGDGIATVLLNDVTVGSYQVSVEMGPSYSTKREEAREGMQTLMQTLGPQAAPLFADLFVKGQDFPLADKIAKRLRQLLPPQLAAQEAAESGDPPPPPPPPPPPNPEIMLKQQELQMKGQEMQGKGFLQEKELEIKNKELAIKEQELGLKQLEIQASIEQARLANEGTAIAHSQKAQEQQMTWAESQAQREHEMAQGQAQRDHERSMSAMEGAASVATARAVPSDEQQQKQLDALTNAVIQLQAAVSKGPRHITLEREPPSAMHPRGRITGASVTEDSNAEPTSP